jgi:hypothetical protein
MGSREDLYQALRNADAAGDVEAAQKLAAYIQSMPAEQPVMIAPAVAPEKTGVLRAAADIPVQVGRGVAVGVKALSDAFGADNPVSKAASGVEDWLGGLLSAQSKNDQAEIARIMKDAQDKGVGDQVTAAVKAFATAPVDMLSQALGTAVPVIAGGLAGSIARLGGMGALAVRSGIGATMGVGTTKGQIYDAVKQELLQNKVPEAEAERRAQQAQEYGGQNLDQILIGAGLGAAEAAFGAERILTGLLKKGAVKPSALPTKYRIPTAAATEAVPEMAQAAQEQLAQNIALQREGYDVPTMRGVAGQAALEGLAGAGLGALTGAVERTEAPKPKPEPEEKSRALEYKPDTLVVFPDGSVGKRGDVENYINSLPEDQRIKARARLLGMGEKLATPIEVGVPLTEDEIFQLDRQLMVGAPRPSAEDVLGQVRGAIQTAPATTPEDVARIRDEHETAVINSLLEQDKKMQAVSDLARANIERISQVESMEAATKDADARVRESRLLGRVQSLIDQNIPFASTAIADINRKFDLIGEAPLDESERSRAQNIMTMAQGFTDFVKLPSLPTREQDRLAEESAMQELESDYKKQLQERLQREAQQQAQLSEKKKQATTQTVLQNIQKRGGIASIDEAEYLQRQGIEGAFEDIDPMLGETISATAMGMEKQISPQELSYRVAQIKERKSRGQVPSQPVRAEAPAPSQVVQEAPVSPRVEEGRAVRPEGGVEPSVAEDRERVEPVVAKEEAVTPSTQIEDKERFTPAQQTLLDKLDKVIGTKRESEVLFRLQQRQEELENLRKIDRPLKGKRGEPSRSMYGEEIDALQQEIYDLEAIRQEAKRRDKTDAGKEMSRFLLRQARDELKTSIASGEITPEQASRLVEDARTTGNAEVASELILDAVDKAQEKALPSPAIPSKKKSLRADKAQQVADFEQTLRTTLNKFGLKDVGLNIVNGLKEAGSYAQQLIKIAADSANPIRDLRHEAIHALRELGFFTDAQWNSLSKMAKDKWIDQYLKQQNVDGKPLKAGEESRYDAYVREYNGDMEKITEEAVADAFADFDATKPPSGLMQALLTRMRNLFQAIKSALTKVESPEQIFGKVERGELKAGERKEAGEKKSLRAEKPTSTPTTAGQEALNTINQLGMGVQPAPASKIEEAKAMLTGMKENPSLAKKQALDAFRKFMDKFEGWSFSADAPFQNDLRRGLQKDMAGMEEFIGSQLDSSQSQAVGADAVSTQAVLRGRAEYDTEVRKWLAIDDKNNLTELSRQLEKIAEKYGLTKEEAQRVAHTYFVAKNYDGILKRNARIEAEIEQLRAEGKTDEANEREAALVFVSDEQAALVGPGKSLVKTIPELSQLVETWDGIRKNFVKTLVSTGLWSPEYATAMIDNIDYVPFYREEQIEANEGPREMIRGLQVKAKEHKLKGSVDSVNDVFDNMARWMQYAMNRSIRNHKALQMIDVATELKVGDKPMAEQVSEAKRGMNIVKVWRGGKQELYSMADPLYLEAFQSLGTVSIPAIKYFTEIANMLRRSVVAYPLFSLGQVPQDAVAAIFSSGLKPRFALKIPYLAVKEFLTTLRGSSRVHEDLKRYGAVGVRDFNAAVLRQDAEITAGLKAPRGVKDKVMYMLDHIAMSADNAVRQAVYSASMEAGLQRSEAMEKAFDIINFRRRGSSKLLNLMGQTVPFFYAYLSAQRVAYRTLTGTGISPTTRKAALETLAQTTAAVMALSFLYSMANGDDEDYEKTPGTIRDRSLLIPGSGGVRIPLRPDFFLFPKIIGEHTYQLLSDNGFSDGPKFRKAMSDVFANSVLSPNPVPQAIKPLVEIGINYSFFEGRPIVGFFEQNKEAGRQFNESTSEMAKLLGQYGMSPEKVDHFVRGYFGSVGGLALWGTNFFIEGESGVPRPELTWKDAFTTMPGVGAFRQKPNENALKVDFYELRDAIEKAKNTYDDIKRRSPEGLEAFIQDEKNLARLGMEKGVTKIADHLSKIRRAVQQVTNMPEEQMSAKEKQERIKELREVEMEMLKAVNVKSLRAQAQL